MKNYYQTLGVKPTASKEEIKEAYLKLSKKVHPDVNGGDHFFTELFKNINEAYQFLMDDAKRKTYNLQLNNFGGGYNYLKEKEAVLAHRQIRRKLFWKSSISVAIGIAVIAIFSISFGNDNEDETNTLAKIYTKKSAVVEKEEENPANTAANISSSAAIDMRQIFQTRNKIETVPVAKKVKAKKAIPVTKPAVIEKKEVRLKQLTEAEMSKIFNSITVKKRRFNSRSKCIRLIKSSSTNVNNAFSLAGFLQSRGYVIAGRETTPRVVKGIEIDCSTNCISLTVGIVE